VPGYVEDRIVATDIEAAVRVLRDPKSLQCVEDAIGTLL
jgi:hypothetical protein